MNEILEYIKQKYEPSSLIVYGSYADGSNNQNSDFDALVLSKNSDVFHDTSFVGGVQLDLFVYPETYFENEVNYDDFVQIFDGKIVMDEEERGANLKTAVLNYMPNRAYKSEEELRNEIDWCEKMLMRTKRHDAEGMFRWHWVLIDSLEIFCDLKQHMYLGPKKTLKWMKKKYPEAFEMYSKALFEFSEESLEQWITVLKNRMEDLSKE